MVWGWVPLDAKLFNDLENEIHELFTKMKQSVN
jgi:hypothetical protein